MTLTQRWKRLEDVRALSGLLPGKALMPLGSEQWQPLAGLDRVGAKGNRILAGRRVGLIEAKKQKPDTPWRTARKGCLPAFGCIDNLSVRMSLGCHTPH